MSNPGIEIFVWLRYIFLIKIMNVILFSMQVNGDT